MVLGRRVVVVGSQVGAAIWIRPCGSAKVLRAKEAVKQAVKPEQLKVQVIDVRI